MGSLCWMELNWSELNWADCVCIIVVSFVRICAHSMLNICSLFRESLEIYSHVVRRICTHKKHHTFIESLQHMCALEFVDTVMLDLFSHSINESNSAMPFFSLSSNLKQISKWNALTFHHINDWYDRFRIVCILLPHVEFTFQVDWNLNSKFIEIQFTYWTSYILIISSTTSTTTTTTMTTRHTK